MAKEKQEPTISKTLIKSWKILWGNYQLFFSIALTAYIPFTILNAILGNPPIQTTQRSFLIIGVGLLKILFAWIVYMAVTDATSKILLKKKTTIQASYRKAFEKLLPFLLITIVATLTIMVSSVFLIIPAIALLIYMLFYTQAMVIDDKNYFSSISYSFEIVTGRWWRVLGFFIVTFILTFLTYLTILLSASFLIGKSYGFLIGGLLSETLSVYFSICYTIYYLNLTRVKKNV
jgi:hypothetical protein